MLVAISGAPAARRTRRAARTGKNKKNENKKQERIIEDTATMSWHRPRPARRFNAAPAENPVVMAISNNDRKHLVHLLENGASPDARYRDTCPLVFAAHRGELDVIDLLRAHKADINQKDAQGATALIAAASGGNAALCAALIARGAALDAQDNKGNTALFHAARKKDHDTFALLVRAGASADIANAQGQTVTDYLNLPENTALRATFEAACKDAEKVDVAAATRVVLRKPLQLKPK